MTIFGATQMWSVDVSGTSSQDGSTVRKTFRTGYQVRHSADAKSDEIEAGCGVAPRETYPGYPSVFCTDRNISKRGLNMSTVMVDYEGEVTLSGDDPANQFPDIRYRSASKLEETDEDAYGIPLTTTAGEPVYGLRADVIDMQLEVKRNYTAINGRLTRQYLHSTNSDNFQVFDDIWQPGEAAMTSFEASPVYNDDGSVKFFTVRTVIELREPYRTTSARAWWHRYRNEGLYARFDTQVSFSGGGGSLAAGYPIANNSGAITEVVMTCRGRNYTTPPTITFTSEDGGSGASATANLGTNEFEGEVVSVTVNSGGTGYKTGVQRIVDDNKEPITKPVLLAADGTKLENAGQAFWVERPRKLFYLPYNDLGLFT